MTKFQTIGMEVLNPLQLSLSPKLTLHMICTGKELGDIDTAVVTTALCNIGTVAEHTRAGNSS